MCDYPGDARCEQTLAWDAVFKRQGGGTRGLFGAAGARVALVNQGQWSAFPAKILLADCVLCGPDLGAHQFQRLRSDDVGAANQSFIEVEVAARYGLLLVPYQTGDGAIR